MKHSSSTAVGTSRVANDFRLAPTRPNISSSTASSSRASAYLLRNSWRLAQLMSKVVVMAPPINAARLTRPASARPMLPTTRSSAMDETMPVMCEV